MASAFPPGRSNHGSVGRTALFWCHLACGVTAGVIILIMSVSGVALTYEKQVIAWADMRSLSEPVQTSDSPRPLDALVRAAQASADGKTATALTVAADPSVPAKVTFGRDGFRYVDPYRALVLGSGDDGMRRFMAWVSGWHRVLGATAEGRAAARAITGAANLAFLVLVLTGLVLWFPHRLTWTHIRQVLLFRGGLREKARDYNWHHVLGFWSFVPLVLIVSSGVVISYRWAGDLLARVAGDSPTVTSVASSGNRTGGPAGERRAERARGDQPASKESPVQTETDADAARPTVALESFVTAASTKVPDWRTITVPLPVTPGKTVNVAIDRGTGGQPQLRATLSLDATTASELSWLPFDAQSPARRARSFMRFAHTGEYFGLFGQTIAGVVTLATILLVWTGIALAWRRLREAMRRPARSAGGRAHAVASDRDGAPGHSGEFSAG